jgi:metal-responsive CopG/Arc/MetJ family transcriptional regulator
MLTAYLLLTSFTVLWQRSAMDEANTERIITPMSKSLVEAIDDFRFSNRVASRSEAIRQLIAMGLEAAKKREKRW